MKYLSQRDPEWCNIKLGSSQLSVGRYGCTSTCLSMATDYFGCYMDPGSIARNTHNYTADGLIVWTNLNFPCMKFVHRDYMEVPSTIMQYIRDPLKVVILNVNQGQHWVLAIGKTFFGSDWVVIDPWTGKKCNAKAVYHDVTGAAYFTKS